MKPAFVWLLATALAAEASTDDPAGAATRSPAPWGPLRMEWAVERSTGSSGELEADRLDQATWSLRGSPAWWQWGLDVPVLQRRDADGRAAGLGDVVLKLSRELQALGAVQSGWDLAVKWKTATGSAARGLGTGASDAVVQLEWAHVAPAQWLVFGELGYRVTGTPAGRTPRRNAWHAELGAQSPWVADWQWGAFAHAREAVSRVGPQAELTVYGQQRWGRQQLRLHVTRGNGLGSAAWAAGLAWSQRWP